MQQGFLSGKIAMIVQGPWLANVINTFAPGMDYGVAPFPVETPLYHPDRPVGILESDVLVVPPCVPIR